MTYLRRLPKFEYLAPRTVAEACALLAAHHERAELLAGGTDLLLQMRRRETTPAFVIGLKGVPELSGLRQLDDGGVFIGAMTTLHSVLTSPLVRRSYGVVAEAAAGIGGPELRNVATVGGNIAGALPCADMPPALMTLGAKVRLASVGGERMLPLEDFFPGFGKTAARPDELLVGLQLPSIPSLSGGVYLKFHDRQSMDMTTVGVSAFVTLDEDSRVFRDVRIALASSAPVPLRVRKAETLLRGRPCGDDALEEAARAVCEEANPRSSWRATSDYRFALIKNLTKRAIRGARDNAANRTGDVS
jgi:CO/xanthine dehydrogenase FAD-binding subunit